MPALDGFLAQAENLRRLGDGQALHGPQHKDLTILRTQLHEDAPDAVLDFVADRRLARGRAAGDQPVYKLDRGLLGQREITVRLTKHAALAGQQVAAAQIDQPLPGDLPEPGIK